MPAQTTSPPFGPSSFAFPQGAPGFARSSWGSWSIPGSPTIPTSTPTTQISTSIFRSSSTSDAGPSTSSTSTVQSTNSGRAGRIKVSSIAGIVVGSAIIILVLIGIFVAIRRRRYKRQGEQPVPVHPFHIHLPDRRLDRPDFPTRGEKHTGDATHPIIPNTHPVSQNAQQSSVVPQAADYGALRSQTAQLLARVSQLEDLVSPERGVAPPCYESELRRGSMV